VAVVGEEEGGSACGGCFFSNGSTTATADCDMQPMEKGKPAPRRSFIGAGDDATQTVQREGEARRKTQSGVVIFGLAANERTTTTCLYS
jgi:hypothetical protein